MRVTLCLLEENKLVYSGLLHPVLVHLAWWWAIDHLTGDITSETDPTQPPWCQNATTVLYVRLFFVRTSASELLFKNPKSWVFALFIWVFWKVYLVTSIVYPVKLAFFEEKGRIFSKIPEFSEKIPELCRKPEFFADLSFSKSAQKKSLNYKAWITKFRK